MNDLSQIEHHLKSSFIKNSTKLEQLNVAQEYKAQAYSKKNLFHQAYANLYLAEIFSDMGELSISCDLLHRIMPFFQEYKCCDYLHQAHLLLGYNENLRGNIETSVQEFDNALSLNLSSPEGSARVLHHLVNYLLKFGRHKEALLTAERALQHLSLKSKFQRKLYFKILVQLAQTLILQRNNEKSLDVLNKIKKAQKTQQLPDIDTLLDQSYGLLFEKMDNLSKAEYYYKKAIRNSKHDESLLICLSIQVNLSNLYMKNGAFIQAEELFLKTYNSYPYEENEYFLMVLSNLAEVYQLIGNKKEQNRFEQELCLRASKH